MRTVALNNGVEMPIIGFGVFEITDPDQCRRAELESWGRSLKRIAELDEGDYLRDPHADPAFARLIKHYGE